MKKKLMALCMVVALASCALPAVAYAGGHGQTGAGTGQGRGACGALRCAVEGFGGSFADWTVAAVLGAQGGSAGANALAGHFAAGCAESCPGYVDEDGDGVCDWRSGAAAGAGSRGACPGYVDADGDGVCDACGNAVGACPGYVDEDGDGVCDRYGQGACGGNAGCGRGVGCGHGWRR